MSNIDAIKQEIKESLEKKLLQAYAEGDETFEQFVSGLSEEQKDLLPGLTSLLEAGGNPALVGKGPPSASSLMNSNPLRGAGGFAGFGGFPNTQSKPKPSTAPMAPTPKPAASPVSSAPPLKSSPPPVARPAPVMGSYNNVPGTPGAGGVAQGAYVKASNGNGYESKGQNAPGSPGGPAPSRPAAVAPKPAPAAAVAPRPAQAAPPAVKRVAAGAPSRPNKPVQNVAKPPVKPVRAAPKPARAPAKPVQRTAKPSFRSTGASNIGSHMSKSMGGLGEETHIKESFESFLRNKFLKGE